MGLIIYDVFFTFGTDVMMTVAQGFTVPMKLLFPHIKADGGRTYAMLDIGDIIIPGLLTSLAKRIDFVRNLRARAIQREKRR